MKIGILGVSLWDVERDGDGHMIKDTMNAGEKIAEEKQPIRQKWKRKNL